VRENEVGVKGALAGRDGTLIDEFPCAEVVEGL
jgi:hypothetical protein